MAAMRDLRSAILPVLPIFFWLLSGCSAPAPAQPPTSPPAAAPAPAAPTTPADARPAEPVDIRGRVTQARRNAQGDLPVGTLQVEGALEPGTRYDKATIHVGHGTKIFFGRGGRPASFSFIHSGDLVEVTFVGPVAESYPVKATADRIVILEHIP